MSLTPLHVPSTNPLTFHLTDAGNAQRLVAEHAHALRHVGAWSQWLTWDGRRWSRDSVGEVVERAKAVARKLWDDIPAVPTGDRKDFARWAVVSESAGRIDAMVRLARTDPAVAIEPDDLDADPWLLNTSSGTIDLRTGRLRPHDPADHITKLAPVTYRADAACPAWRMFLETVLPEEELRAFVQRAAGYSLTGLTTEQCLFFLFGFGANGKSTFTETLQRSLGDYAGQADPELLLAREHTHPTGVADLMGKRMVVVSEFDDGRRLAEATVKQLTGGDTVKARFMRENFFEYRPTHKLWLHANHRPVVRGTDLAIWRRLRLVPFTVTIPPEQQDRRLVERLAAERAGILAWAVEGCMRWQEGGLQEPEAVTRATADYRAEMDLLGAFLAEGCLLEPGAFVAAADLYRSYVAWCEANGERPATQRRLGMALTERGFERQQHGTNRRWHWFGLRSLGQDDEQTLLNPRTDANPDSRINAHARARVARTQEKGSDWVQGFTSSAVAGMKRHETTGSARSTSSAWVLTSSGWCDQDVAVSQHNAHAARRKVEPCEG